MDAALIGAAQRVEHCEIAAYGTASTFAETLGETEHVSLLNATLEEEKETGQKLTELASQINQDVNRLTRRAKKQKKLVKEKLARKKYAPNGSHKYHS